MARCLRDAFVLALATLVLPFSRAADPFWGADPAWSLFHEPAVENDLKRSPSRSRDFRGL